MSTALFSSRKSANSRTTRYSLPGHLRSYPASLRCAAALGLGLLSLGVFAGQPAHAGTVTWSGGDGSWFGSPSQWSNGSTPSTTDDVKNLTSALITLGQSTTINSFFSTGGFDLTGGTFSGNQANSASTLQVNNVFTDNGGQINNFTVNQGTGGSLVFTTSGGNSIANSIINSSMDLATNGNAFVHLYGTDTVNGAIRLGTSGGGNGIGLDNGTTNFVLGSGGSLTGFGQVFQFNGGATFANNGTINANSSVNALTLALTNFNNAGTTEATNGATLNLNNTNTNAAVGSILAAKGAGSVVSIAGTFTGTGNNLITASGGGQVQVNGASLLGTINTDPSTALLFSTSASNHLSDTTVNGNLDLATNSGAFAHLYGTDTVNGAISLGTVVNSGNGIGLDNGTTNFVLGSKGSLAGFGTVFQFNGGATFANNGTINADSSGKTLNLALTTFNNAGTTEATNGGILALQNTTTNNTGLLEATKSGVLDISGTLNSNAGNSINGVGGTVNVLGATLLGTINETTGTSLVFNTSASNHLSDTTVNGNLDLATNSSAFVHLYGTDTVNGAISLGTTTGGNGIGLDNGTTSFVLGSGGSLTGFGQVFQFNGGATFANNGTINANSSASPLTLALTTFSNNAMLEATKGATLNLNNTNTNAAAGSTLAAKGAGSIVSIAGTFTGTGNNLITASGGGQVQVNGANLLGTINTDPSTALLFSTSASNHLNNTTVNGNLDLATNSSAFMHLYGTDTFNGRISLGTTTGGNGIGLDNGTTNFVLGSKGSLAGFGSVFEFNGGSTLTNKGTINADSRGKTLALALTNFNNVGTAEATNGGTLALNNTTSNNTGLLAATGGGILNISGTLNSNAGNSINGVGGTVNVLGATLLGTINETTGTSLVFNTSASNHLSDTTVNGNLDLATNSGAFAHLYGTDTVNGAISLGTVVNSGNGIGLDNGTTSFVLGSGGSLTGFGTVFQFNGGATFANNGTINANTSGKTLNLALTNFNNAGTTEATNGGTLALQNTTTTNSGALNAVGTGSVVSIAGTLIGTGNNLITASGGGQVQVNGASLQGTINTDASTALLFSTSGGNNLSSATVNGNLDLATNSSAFVHLYGTDTVNGAISLGTVVGSGNGIGLDNGTTSFVLGSKGSLTGFGSVFEFNGGSTLTNKGTINANSSGKTLAISTSNFTNTGTTEVQNGAALSVGGVTADSGNILVKTGGTATFGQGITQTGGLTTADGTLNSALTLTGGTLTGNGTVNGAVVNNGGTVKAGDAFGTLAVNGAFTQTTNGTLDAQFTQAQASLLAVSGVVTTGGTLAVNYLGTVPYTVGSGPFTFLDYGSLGTEGTNVLGLTQYFTNETALTNDTGLITGSNGFTYELLNNTAANSLQLQVLTAGTPAVPEASTTVSFGLLLALGGAGLWSVKRRRTAAAR